MDNSHIRALKPLQNLGNFPPHRRLLMSETCSTLLQILSYCPSTDDSATDKQKLDDNGSSKLGKENGVGELVDRHLIRSENLLVTGPAHKKSDNLVVQQGSGDGNEGSSPDGYGEFTGPQMEVDLDHLNHKSDATEDDRGDSVTNDIIDMSCVVEKILACNDQMVKEPGNSCSTHESEVKEPDPIRQVELDKEPSIDDVSAAIESCFGADAIADLSQPTDLSGEKMGVAESHLSEEMKHGLRVKEMELETLVSSAGTKDSSVHIPVGEEMEEGEAFGDFVVFDESDYDILNQVGNEKKDEADESPADILGREEFAFDVQVNSPKRKDAVVSSSVNAVDEDSTFLGGEFIRKFREEPEDNTEKVFPSKDVETSMVCVYDTVLDSGNVAGQVGGDVEGREEFAFDVQVNAPQKKDAYASSSINAVYEDNTFMGGEFIRNFREEQEDNTEKVFCSKDVETRKVCVYDDTVLDSGTVAGQVGGDMEGREEFSFDVQVNAPQKKDAYASSSIDAVDENNTFLGGELIRNFSEEPEDNTEKVFCSKDVETRKVYVYDDTVLDSGNFVGEVGGDMELDHPAGSQFDSTSRVNAKKRKFREEPEDTTAKVFCSKDVEARKVCVYDTVLDGGNVAGQVGGDVELDHPTGSQFDSTSGVNAEKRNLKVAAENENIGKKEKKRGPSTKERKANRKAKERIKRAKERIKLGIKRPMLPPVVKPKVVRYCHHYLKGRCFEGDKCNFSHNTVPLTKSKPCCHFARQSCMKGDDCPFDHQLSKYPCDKYASQGFCNRGADCLFSHEVTAKTVSVTSPTASNPSNSNSLIQVNTGMSNKDVKSASGSTGLVPGKSTKQTVSEHVRKPAASAPKGVTFLSHGKSLQGDARKHKEVGLSSKADDVGKISCQIIHSKSDNAQKPNGYVKGTSTRTPQGMNFLSFGRVPLAKPSSDTLSSMLNMDYGVESLQLGSMNNSKEVATCSKRDDSFKDDSQANISAKLVSMNQMLTGNPPGSVPRGVNFLSVDKAVEDRSHPNEFNCASSPIERRQNAPNTTSNEMPFRQLSSLFPARQSLIRSAQKCNAEIACSSKSPFFANTPSSIQKALRSTLAFAAKFDLGVKYGMSNDSPDISSAINHKAGSSKDR